MKNTINTIFDGYFTERENYMKKNMLSERKMAARLIKSREEYLRLAEEEVEFQEHFSVWVDGIFKNHEICKSKAELIKHSLKTLKEKLNSRQYFLILFSSMVTLMFAATEALFTQKVGMNTVILSSVVCLLLLWERFNSFTYMSAAEELSCVVDYWLKTKSEL